MDLCSCMAVGPAQCQLDVRGPCTREGWVLSCGRRVSLLGKPLLQLTKIRDGASHGASALLVSGLAELRALTMVGGINWSFSCLHAPNTA